MKADVRLKGRVFLTGGSGSLGHAIVHLAKQLELDCQFTIYSRDPMKQGKMRQVYPDLHFVIGDVRNTSEIARAMAGHDLVIHAAAMKHIPQAEYDPQSCYSINVDGSRNVLDAALAHGIRDVVLISTDKVCHPINAYGCSKLMMERLAFSYIPSGLNIYLPRYGNVVSSTGSVLQVWHKQISQGQLITVTDLEMTRFWLTPEHAAEIVIESLYNPNHVYVPKLPALSIKKMIAYALEKGVKKDITGLRPGEKMHEELLTWEESAYAADMGDAYLVRSPVTSRAQPYENYSSDAPVREVTRSEMRHMLGLDE